MTALLEYLDMTALLELSILIVVDGQVLAMLLQVILVNFNESISKITQIIIMTIFILSWQDVGTLSPAIICSNKGRKNDRRIIGTVWELKKNNRQFF